MSERRVRFSDLSIGAEVPRLARTVVRGDIETYADASGDHNPLHLDDDFARSVGFPGVVAHGMFTMGHLVRCLTDWLGDPASLARVRVQFRTPVFIGDTLVAGGRVKELDPGGRRALLEVWVTVERGGATEYPIRRSEAELRFPND